MIDLEETLNESSIEDKSSSANEIGIEIDNQTNTALKKNRLTKKLTAPNME